MKIQTTARIENFIIDDTPQDLPGGQTIDLEFSAIDTGGGFKDPILDFSFTIPKDAVNSDIGDGQESEITLTLGDSNQGEDRVSFSYTSRLQAVEEERFEINGRLKDDQLSREMIDFVFKLLR